MSYFSNPGPQLLGKLIGANMNTTADQPLVIASSNFVLTDIWATNASTSLTLAAGGFYTGAGKTGTILVAAAQVYSGLTGATKVLHATLAAGALDRLTTLTTYLSLTVAQGGVATCDLYVYGYALD